MAKRHFQEQRGGIVLVKTMNRVLNGDRSVAVCPDGRDEFWVAAINKKELKKSIFLYMSRLGLCSVRHITCEISS